MGTSYGLVSVSVCVCHNSVKQIGWFLAWGLLSTSHTMCYKEIRAISKIRALPSGTSLQTPDLENFAIAYRSSRRVINSARERWKLKARQPKLGHRRSTKLTIPPSSDARLCSLSHRSSNSVNSTIFSRRSISDSIIRQQCMHCTDAAYCYRRLDVLCYVCWSYP